MTGFAQTQTLWLQVTNAGLAIGCVLLMAVLAVVVIRELASRRHRLAEIVRLDHGDLELSNLGSTMAVGGTPYVDTRPRITAP